MFTVEVKVNGFLAAHIYGKNIGCVKGNNYAYEYEYFEVDGGFGSENKNVIRGNIVHNREERIIKLIYIILGDVNVKRKKI